MLLLASLMTASVVLAKHVTVFDYQDFQHHNYDVSEFGNNVTVFDYDTFSHKNYYIN